MREAGILMPISSLPSKYGIGCFDEAAYAFVDQIAAAGQSLWQILPVGPTSYGDSPYQAFSTFAGNPYFISPDSLKEAGWVTEKDLVEADAGDNPRYVDYGALYTKRWKLLRKAYANNDICATKEFAAFTEANAEWLNDYALFMALKDAHDGKAWMEWEDDLRLRDPEALMAAREEYADGIRFYEFLQYLFYTQMGQLMEYVHSKGIRVIGDIPIYVALDSADTWSHPELFQLDEDRKPVQISGCPPDAFAADGQLWGNPLYDWPYHKKTGYVWWIRRIKNCLRTCDILRIDHFRGFDEYFSIPAADKTAVNGHWEKGPGMDLFVHLKTALPDTEIIAEDLGYVTNSVRQLVKDTGFAGIKVLEFAFDSRDTGAARDYLPHNYPVNSVAYTGTHDNAPITGWMEEILPEERRMVRDYLATDICDDKIYWAMDMAVLRSVARIAVIPIQDYLGYGNEARMNKPSTAGTNWRWRLLDGELTPELIRKIRRAAELTGRCVD